VLRREGKAFHIEVKRMGALPGVIYWSDLEFSKAGELREPYCLAALLEAADEYKVSWIWQPVVQLGQATRHVEWVWEGKKIEELQPGAWVPAIPGPQMPPRSHVYRITVDQSLYHSWQSDASDLAILRTRIELA
jgi:hypothetical protein